MKIDIPKTSAEERSNFILPTSIKKLGILSDIHFPYHSEKSLIVALEKCYNYGVDAILLNGDSMDFYQASKYEKDPRKRDFNFEFDVTRHFLDELKKNFPAVYFKIGNHEERWMRYLQRKAPEVLGMREFQLDIILRLGEKGIHYVDNKRIIKAGGLSIFHGHEINLNSAVNPARSLFLRTQISSLCGHLHTPSYHSEKRADGHIVGCWSTGHLGEESPDYSPYNKWQYGFATVELNKKEFEVSNYKIINNKAYRT
jgi:predicted phosphodiesterase